MIAVLDDDEGLLGGAELLAGGAEPAARRVRPRRRAFRLSAGYALLTVAGGFVLAVQSAAPVSEPLTDPVPASWAVHPSPPHPGRTAEAGIVPARTRRDLPQPDRLTTPRTGRRAVSGVGSVESRRRMSVRSAVFISPRSMVHPLRAR